MSGMSGGKHTPELDEYGNPLDGSELINCCFPDCGCGAARLCMAKNGASRVACLLNIEQGTFAAISKAGTPTQDQENAK